MFILLPKTIPVLRPREHQSIRTDKEEYNLYFANIIHPYQERMDVQVHCDYGRNYGTFWRLDAFPYDVNMFPLSIVVYDENGNLLAEKSTTIEIYEKDACQAELSVLTIGDSMTQAQKYLEHVSERLRGIRFVGSRSFDGVIAHEGRGGFASEDYRRKHQDPYAYSPFVFPKGVDATDYYGDISFWTVVNENPEANFYVYDGYPKRFVRDGQIYNREDVLYQMKNGTETIYQDAPQWEFHFGKYLQQQSFSMPDAVSVLLGTNDIMKFTYDDMESGIARTMQNMDEIIASIRENAPQSVLLLGLPILPTTSEYAFGKCFGTKKSAKQSRMIMKEYLRRMLEKWDGREAEKIYLVPMYAVIDPVNGFKTDAFSNGLYYEALEVHVGEAIHPNPAGYYQMGDALAAVLQKIRILRAKG